MKSLVNHVEFLALLSVEALGDILEYCNYVKMLVLGVASDVVLMERLYQTPRF